MSTKILKITIQIKKKVLIVFDDMIADMINNKKKLNPMVTKLFIRGRNLNVSIVFITQLKICKKIMKNALQNHIRF